MDTQFNMQIGRVAHCMVPGSDTILVNVLDAGIRHLEPLIVNYIMFKYNIDHETKKCDS